MKFLSWIRRGLKTIWDRWPWIKAAILVLDDLRWGFSLQRGYLDTDSGATHAQLSVDDSLRYIEEVFLDYKRYGGLTRFHGVVAELGPGDNVGVALLMRQDGCHQVDLIDRYFSRRDKQRQNLIYEALSTKHQLERFKTGLSWNDHEMSGISLKLGLPAEVYFRETARRRGDVYDVIVSRSVLEHLYDPLGALEDMVFCLRSGGRMIHKIDLRDHGLFTPQHHELTFLRFPSLFYRYMTKNSGRPNRILFDQYREVLERLKGSGLIDYSIFVTRLTGVGDLIPHPTYETIDEDTWHRATCYVDSCRQEFAREFCKVNSRDLAVAGIFLVATRW